MRAVRLQWLGIAALCLVAGCSTDVCAFEPVDGARIFAFSDAGAEVALALPPN